MDEEQSYAPLYVIHIPKGYLLYGPQGCALCETWNQASKFTKAEADALAALVPPGNAAEVVHVKDADGRDRDMKMRPLVSDPDFRARFDRLIKEADAKQAELLALGAETVKPAELSAEAPS